MKPTIVLAASVLAAATCCLCSQAQLRGLLSYDFENVTGNKALTRKMWAAVADYRVKADPITNALESRALPDRRKQQLQKSIDRLNEQLRRRLLRMVRGETKDRLALFQVYNSGTI